MNILPHKSWHVWSQKNVDKVRKDEEEHRKEQDRKRKRELDVEQEHRLETLRERNKRLKGEQPDSSALVIVKREDGKRGAIVPVKKEEDAVVEPIPEEPLKHVNFFEDLELQQRSEDTRNPEYEAEKKAKADRDARQYTTYLGQSAAETQKVKPWYFGPPEATPALPPEKLRKQERFKAEKDPLSAMGAFLLKKKQIDAAAQAKSGRVAGGTPAMLARSMKIAAQLAAGMNAPGMATTTTEATKKRSEDEKKEKKEEKKEKKEKKEEEEKKKKKKKKSKKRSKKKKKKHSSSSSDDSSSDSGDDSDDAEAKKAKLMKLREERMRREAEAKGKTRQLLFGNQAQTPAIGGYSAQFAPLIGGTLRAQDRERRTQDRERRESYQQRHDDRGSSNASHQHHHHRGHSSSSSSRSSRHYSSSSGGRLEGRERGGASLRGDY